MHRLGYVVGGGAGIAALFILSSILASPAVAGAGGSLAGKVTFGGPKPTLEPHKVTSDGEHCGATIENESILVGEGGALKNVIITLEGIAAQPAVEKTVVAKLHNKGCKFIPHVQAVQVGTTLEMTSEDSVLHNVHLTLIGGGDVTNQALPPGPGAVKKRLKEAGIARAKCDAGHGWMRAYVAIVPHPYYAVSADDGKYSIQGVPPGKYKLKAWHETLGTVEKDVEVKEGAEASTGFEFTEKKS